MGNLFEGIIRLHSGFWRRIRNCYYQRVFRECGSGLQVDSDTLITTPRQISAGNQLTINKGAVLQGTEGGRITIGNHVTLSYSAKVLTANLDLNERNHEYKDVVIGNNVWICANAIVLPGVAIGNNVVVAAGAVVTTNLESGYLYAGIPAKRIKAL